MALQEKWDAVKALVAETDLDFTKFVVKENSSAGTRSRKSLRDLKKKLHELVKEMVETEKERRVAAKTPTPSA